MRSSWTCTGIAPYMTAGTSAIVMACRNSSVRLALATPRSRHQFRSLLNAACPPPPSCSTTCSSSDPSSSPESQIKASYSRPCSTSTSRSAVIVPLLARVCRMRFRRPCRPASTPWPGAPGVWPSLPPGATRSGITCGMAPLSCMMCSCSLASRYSYVRRGMGHPGMRPAQSWSILRASSGARTRWSPHHACNASMAAQPRPCCLMLPLRASVGAPPVVHQINGTNCALHCLSAS